MSNEKVSPGFLLTVAVLGSTLLGAIYFIYYFHVIGRADLIMSIMLDNINAFYVFAMLMAVGLLVLILLATPSWVLVVTLSLFKELDLSEDNAIKVNVTLFFSGLVVAFLFGVLWGKAGYPSHWLKWMALSVTLYLFVVIFFLMRYFGCTVKHYRRRESILISFFISIISFLGVSFSVAVTFVVLYFGKNDEDLGLSFIASGLLFSLCTFMPGFIWIITRSYRLRQRIGIEAAVLASTGFLLFSTAPDIYRATMFNAGKIVGLHSNETRKYALINNYANTSRLNLIWPSGIVDESGTFIGKQLFSIAGIELICPTSVTISSAEVISSKRGLGADCILLRSHQVIKGSADLSNGEENAGDE